MRPNEEMYLITLEYGDFGREDPFTVERIHRNNVERAADSKFLHPIVRRYRGLEWINEHHVLEDLVGEWTEDVHRDPLLAYFKDCLVAKPIPLQACAS